MRSSVSWGEAKSGGSHLQILVSNGSDDVECNDGAEAMIRGELLMGVVGSNTWSCRWRKMTMITLTEKAASESKQKWYKVSP